MAAPCGGDTGGGPRAPGSGGAESERRDLSIRPVDPIRTANFLDAVACGQWDEAAAHLQAGADVNGLNSHHSGALEVAIANHPCLVERLLAAGADPNGRRGSLSCGVPLRAASFTLQLDVVQLLIAAGADVNLTASGELPPLHEVCERLTASERDLEVLRALLTAGAKVNALDGEFDAGLLLLRNLAAPPAALALLVEHGLDLAAGADELAYAAAFHSPGMLHTLLGVFAKAGVPVPLQFLQSRGIVNELAARGLTVPVRDPSTRKEDIAALIRTLVTMGVRLDTRTYSPLHGAATQAGFPFEVLIECGIDVDARTHEGITPLHSAACRACVPNVTALLLLGADPTARDARGKTPVDLFGSFSGSHTPEEWPSVLPRPVKIP